MTKPRAIDIAVSLGFLLIIGSAALIQAEIEVREGEGLQALQVLQHPPTPSNLRAYERGLEDASWLAKKVRPWMQYLQFVLFKDGGEKGLVGRDGWFFYRPGVKYFSERPSHRELVRAGADPLPAILDFRDNLRARGIQLLVMPVPDKESVYPDQLTRRAAGLHGVMCPETRELLEQMRRSGVEVVDLFGVFADARGRSNAMAQDLLYMAQDSHWSPAGIDLAARAAAQHLTGRGWIAPGAVDYDERATPVRRQGDVLRMLQVPQVARRVPPEAVSCMKVMRRSNGESYRDDPGAQVLVLGDSFLRVFERDDPGSAGFVAHLARDLNQPLASFIDDGGGSTRVRQELQRQPGLLANRKVVVWEFVERDIRLGTEGWQIVPLPPNRAAVLPGSAARRAGEPEVLRTLCAVEPNGPRESWR